MGAPLKHVTMVNSESACPALLHSGWASLTSWSQKQRKSDFRYIVAVFSAQSCLILCNPMEDSTAGFLVLHNFPYMFKLMSIESVMPSNHLVLCHPLLLLPSIFPSIGSFRTCQLFASGGQSFSFSISPSNEYSGLMSFRMD